MKSLHKNFLKYLAQTSSAPIGLEMSHAKGSYIYSEDGKAYLDCISGIGVSSFGHQNPKIVKAVKAQVDKHMHLMVYGEFIQKTQVELAELLVSKLPETLNSVYLVNSGSEACEGALKLAKKVTGRPELISFTNAYHGSTHGALSLMGNDYFKDGYAPFLPDTKLLEWNEEKELDKISKNTAAVVLETIQGEAGIRVPSQKFMKALRAKCDQTGALLILDEIQCGMGRTGTFMAFEQFGIVPDILLLAKAFGAGMPLGAFVASKESMQYLSDNPVLGHITTFGGHPVSCAASLAGMKMMLEENLMGQVAEKEQLFRSLLNHKSIKEIRGKGLMLAVDLGNPDLVHASIAVAIEQGLITDWFLFDENSLRIAPPLTISTEEIEIACAIINNALHVAQSTQ